MTSLDDQRKTDNEAVFRRYNEAVTLGMENLIATAKREGWGADVKRSDDPLYFYCECSREDCHERILIKPSDYVELHKNRRFFTVLPGHETEEVEKVVQIADGYTVVEKFHAPDEAATKLQKTELTDGK